MTAVPDLLALAREHGVDLCVKGGSIRLRAETEPSAALVEQLREHKTALINLLSHPNPPPLSPADLEDIQEALDERAAIREYDGHQDRDEAERQAQAVMRVFRYRLVDSQGWATLIASGWTLEDAEHDLRGRYGDRLVEVVEHLPRPQETTT